ncbi:hypothetical protein [Actinomadura sp. HBU206391]|uniref:hypothetical protein n=1 Tax=Actinomadura sp. HBU206391 TaxID=2731692 RepID=UPI00164EF28E|nr:hypothetical protein [Actinomadura sp. HBU206391]MBC6457677.1 hypothetical protein [Actinomadura sp. HBU206391]
MRLRSYFGAIGALVIAAGCSSHSTPGSGQPVLSSTPTPTAYGMVGSPLEPYMLSNEQEQTLLKAQDLLARECLRRFGVSTTRPVLPLVGMNGAIRERNKRTFVELEDARRFGYHRSAAFPQAGRLPEQARRRPELPAGAEILINGWRQQNGSTAQTFQGRQVPEYGCRGEAKAKLTHGLSLPEQVKTADSAGVRGSQSLVAGLRRQAIDQLLKDDRYHDVIKRWSACMKQSGHAYANPGAAMRDKRWKTPEPTRAEIDTAVADTTCRLKLNYLGIIGALRTAYEQRQVDRNRPVLQSVRTYLDRVLGNADKALHGQLPE